MFLFSLPFPDKYLKVWKNQNYFFFVILVALTHAVRSSRISTHLARQLRRNTLLQLAFTHKCPHKHTYIRTYKPAEIAKASVEFLEVNSIKLVHYLVHTFLRKSVLHYRLSWFVGWHCGRGVCMRVSLIVACIRLHLWQETKILNFSSCTSSITFQYQYLVACGMHISFAFCLQSFCLRNNGIKKRFWSTIYSYAYTKCRYLVIQRIFRWLNLWAK